MHRVSTLNYDKDDMAGRRKNTEKSSSSSQMALTSYFSLSQHSVNRTPGRTGNRVESGKRLDEPDSNRPLLTTKISLGSSSLSSLDLHDSDPPTPFRRSSRLRASATPGPTATPIPKRQRVLHHCDIATSVAEHRHRAIGPQTIIATPRIRTKSPSSQKDDAEPMIDDDIETLESIPIFHMPSPSTSLSSVEPPTPAVSTPPRPLSPESKTRHIIEEIRARAREAITSTSPTLKRPHSPLEDSDDDSLPDGDFFFGSKDQPSKRRASSTPSPKNVRRSTRKPKKPNVSPKAVVSSKLKLERNPFAALVREHAARAKREESLPRAPDGSHQTIFDIANAALLRDPDASFDDEGGSQEANAALNQLAESGFADEAERVRRAGSTTKVETEWRMFATEEPKDQMLVDLPHEVEALLTTPFAKKVWGWITEKTHTKDYDALAEILNTNLVVIAFSDPHERPALEKVIQWLVELVTLSPSSSQIPWSVQHQAVSLVEYLADSDAYDRFVLHVARCALQVGPPGEGVLLARSVLGELQTEPKYAVTTEEQRSSRVLLCASLLRTVAPRTQNIFPAVVVLCLLGLDPSLQVGTRSEIAEIIEHCWVAKADSPESQLSLCASLYSAFSELSTQQKRDLVIRVLRGTRSVGVQLCMWLATGFLDSKGLEGVSPETYTSRPPLDRIAAFVHTIHITPETNYADLLYTAQLLDIAMWDVEALVQAERRAGRIVKYQPGVPIDSVVGEVIAHLADVHGRILDARATDLEKTTTKAYLQTLQVRLGWDLMEAARSGQRKGLSIKEMWGKPRPKPA
ncbi:hypothetical protein OPQ81_009959 [Rhizoctonia solani]|nr:hypothetical protein OPQ81_009959 [Rhizoctonia solani]